MAIDPNSLVHSHPSVARVRDALLKAGLADTITVMPEATHTAQAAADALSCDVGEIAKSIIFRAEDGRAVLVITSGRNRVDDKKVAAKLDQKIGKADADFVRAQTGFVIGGVAPLAHAAPPIALMDEDLLRYAAIWPAAGHPNSMFRISPQDLARVTGAEITDIAQRKRHECT
jgi:prolyl-tRNA editing enzyme YbaK/EbsC (Cys-tRNA(Pro) deacylase)